ncbi:MAG TPA: hypothetical protein VK447_07480, partial [Myxococcaceae bacterium]|nr:hypothetical protein [Myxococcaceae bacterium]
YATFFAVVTAESINRIERAETALREAFSVYVYLIASIIRYGQKKTGEMRTDVDADTMAHALVSTFAGLIVHQQLFRQEVSYEPLVGTLNMLMVDGACQTDRAPTEGRARAANQ